MYQNFDKLYLIFMITKLGRQLLEEKLLALKEELRLTYQKRSEAAAEGDLKENSAYIYAGEHANLLNSQIEEIVSDLKNFIIKSNPTQFETVEFGHQVTLLYPDQRQVDFVLVGKYDARLKPNWIYYQSPIGLALLSKKIGTQIQINDQTITLLSISSGDI